MKHTKFKRSSGQDGFASIVIAIIMVLVLSLMTVGFADLMRKETRRALDKQLSTQAFFAAESGINDAAKAMNAGFDSAKTTCPKLPSAATGPGVDYLKDNVVSTATNSSYTCLTINPTPDTLQYGAIDFSQSKAVTITGIDPGSGSTTTISSLTISWQDVDGSQKGFVTGGGHSFETAAGWTYTGLLRIGLTPLASTLVKRDELIKNTSTIFLFPNADGGTDTAPSDYNSASYSTYTENNAGGIVDGNCNTASRPLACNVTITGLNQANYLLDMRSIYSKTNVKIAAYDLSGNKLKIKNAQTVIDSTGKSQDVLRRLQVRVPSHTEFYHPDYSLQTAGDICKQLILYPDSGSNTCD